MIFAVPGTCRTQISNIIHNISLYLFIIFCNPKKSNKEHIFHSRIRHVYFLRFPRNRKFEANFFGGIKTLFLLDRFGCKKLLSFLYWLLSLIFQIFVVLFVIPNLLDICCVLNIFCCPPTHPPSVRVTEYAVHGSLHNP